MLEGICEGLSCAEVSKITSVMSLFRSWCHNCETHCVSFQLVTCSWSLWFILSDPDPSSPTSQTTAWRRKWKREQGQRRRNTPAEFAKDQWSLLATLKFLRRGNIRMHHGNYPKKSGRRTPNYACMLWYCAGIVLPDTEVCEAAGWISDNLSAILRTILLLRLINESSAQAPVGNQAKKGTA